MEECGEKFWIVVDVLRGLLHFCVEIGVVFRNEVDEKDVLHAVPALFDGVQLRRVGRKIFKDKPIGMFAFEEILGRDVGREPIPNDDRLFMNMTMQLRQPENKILGDARTVHDREVLLVRSTEMKFHFATGWCRAEETKAGLIASRVRFAQNGRLADLRPGRTANRREREAAFVHENQGCAKLLCFFLTDVPRQTALNTSLTRFV